MRFMKRAWPEEWGSAQVRLCQGGPLLPEKCQGVPEPKSSPLKPAGQTKFDVRSTQCFQRNAICLSSYGLQFRWGWGQFVGWWGCSCSSKITSGNQSIWSAMIFGYASSSTLYPYQWVGGSQFRTSVASRLASLLQSKQKVKTPDFSRFWPFSLFPPIYLPQFRSLIKTTMMVIIVIHMTPRRPGFGRG